jgi:spore coat polysaccharide biosynthesis protein SpsF (cytidylyltransferase family)
LILQARIGSSRLPGKVLKQIAGRPLIQFQINRIRKSKLLNNLVVAIPIETENDSLERYLRSENIEVYRGAENDVLSRFEGVISKTTAEVIIRSTADCPLFMPEILDEMLGTFYQSDLDYLSNSISPTYPDGLDIEIFSKTAFNVLLQTNPSKLQREHVTLGFYDGTNSFKTQNFTNKIDLSMERWTVDYQEDFDFVKKIFEKSGQFVTFHEVLQLLEDYPEVRNSKTSEFRNIALSGKEPNA